MDSDVQELSEAALVAMREKFAGEIRSLEEALGSVAAGGRSASNAAVVDEINGAVAKSKEVLRDLETALSTHRAAAAAGRRFTAAEADVFRYFGFEVQPEHIPDRTDGSEPPLPPPPRVRARSPGPEESETNVYDTYQTRPSPEAATAEQQESWVAGDPPKARGGKGRAPTVRRIEPAPAHASEEEWSFEARVQEEVEARVGQLLTAAEEELQARAEARLAARLRELEAGFAGTAGGGGGEAAATQTPTGVADLFDVESADELEEKINDLVAFRLRSELDRTVQRAVPRRPDTRDRETATEDPPTELAALGATLVTTSPASTPGSTPRGKQQQQLLQLLQQQPQRQEEQAALVLALSAELDSLGAAHAALEASHAALRQAADRLGADGAAAAAENDRLAGEARAQKAVIHGLREELETAGEENARAQKAVIHRLREQLEAAGEENDRLAGEARAQKAVVHSLREELEAAGEETARAQKAVIHRLREELGAAGEENDRLAGEARAQNAAIHRLREQLGTAGEPAAALAAAAADLERAAAERLRGVAAAGDHRRDVLDALRGIVAESAAGEAASLRRQVREAHEGYQQEFDVLGAQLESVAREGSRCHAAAADAAAALQSVLVDLADRTYQYNPPAAELHPAAPQDPGDAMLDAAVAETLNALECPVAVDCHKVRPGEYFLDRKLSLRLVSGVVYAKRPQAPGYERFSDYLKRLYAPFIHNFDISGVTEFQDGGLFALPGGVMVLPEDLQNAPALDAGAVKELRALHAQQQDLLKQLSTGSSLGGRSAPFPRRSPHADAGFAGGPETFHARAAFFDAGSPAAASGCRGAATSPGGHTRFQLFQQDDPPSRQPQPPPPGFAYPVHTPLQAPNVSPPHRYNADFAQNSYTALHHQHLQYHHHHQHQQYPAKASEQPRASEGQRAAVAALFEAADRGRVGLVTKQQLLRALKARPDAAARLLDAFGLGHPAHLASFVAGIPGQAAREWPVEALLDTFCDLCPETVLDPPVPHPAPRAKAPPRDSAKTFNDRIQARQREITTAALDAAGLQQQQQQQRSNSAKKAERDRSASLKLSRSNSTNRKRASPVTPDLAPTPSPGGTALDNDRIRALKAKALRTQISEMRSRQAMD